MDDDGQLLSVLADLIVPERRDAGLEELRTRGMLDDGGIRLIHTLGMLRYGDRNVGVRLSEVKAKIDQYVQSNRYCFLSPMRSFGQLMMRLELSNSKRDKRELIGGRAVDFGCGVYNPLGEAIILYANGVDRIYAVEPASIRGPMAKQAALETVKHMMGNPDVFNFTGIDATEMKVRVASLDLGKLDNLDGRVDPEGVNFGGIVVLPGTDHIEEHSVDFVYSTSVLEHVRGLERVMQKQRKMLTPGGIAVHVVDFTDHRHDDAEYHPFKFYYDGKMKDCNGLRDVDMIDIFTEAGFGVELERVLKVEENVIDTGRLSERYSTYRIENLCTKSAAFILS
jgi:SAM-dependent methyltransferase